MQIQPSPNIDGAMSSAGAISADETKLEVGSAEPESLTLSKRLALVCPSGKVHAFAEAGVRSWPLG